MPRAAVTNYMRNIWCDSGRYSLARERDSEDLSWIFTIPGEAQANTTWSPAKGDGDGGH
jgi:hypothetical protein